MSFLMITTSAKTLDDSPDWSAVQTSQVREMETTQTLVEYLASLSVDELARVLGVSSKIAELNFDRLKNWSLTHSDKNSKPAILMYHGDIYKQFVAKDFSEEQQRYAQSYVRISSGLYGLIRPYDLIQPYRLEMKTKLKVTQQKVLAEFWKEKATESLNQDIAESKANCVINFASKEYARVVDEKRLNVPMITIEFKENKNGELKTIPLYSKQARGMMIGFAIENQIRDIEGLKKFNTSGYSFAEAGDKKMIFVRK